MKKKVGLTCVCLMLAACANTPDETLFGNLGWCFSRQPKYQDVEIVTQEIVDGEVVSTVVGGEPGYMLAKRGERYESANYVLTPQEYSIVASRAANKMLEDIPGLLAADKTAPLYIDDTLQIDRYLPEGHYAAGKTARDILYNSGMLNIVTDRSQARYFLQSTINNIGTPEVPVLQYTMDLYDSNDELVGSWSDTLRQVLNDDGSWW